MKKKMITLLALFVGVATQIFAESEIDALKKRISVLENDEPKIEFGAVVEIEYGAVDNADGTDTDDFKLATIELGMVTELDENFDAQLVLLYEEEDAGEPNAEIEVDVAVLGGQTADGKYRFSVGRMYVPFGVYETGAISDPFGLEIGETQDEALLLSANFENGISATIWHANNTDADNAGISVVYTGDNFAVGIDGIDKTNSEEAGNGERGLAVYGSVNIGDWTFIAEQISERDDKKAIGTDTSTAKAAQKATQIEVDLNIDDFSFAVVNNKLTNHEDYDNISSFAVGYILAQNLQLSVEYSIADRIDNTGDDKTTTVQLAYEF